MIKSIFVYAQEMYRVFETFFVVLYRLSKKREGVIPTCMYIYSSDFK